MAERVLVVVAHPDDETFGMGATIARHVRQGDHVAIVCLADGVASRGNQPATFAVRHAQFRSACKILGTEDVFIHQFADNRMDGVPLLQVVQHIERHIERVKPNIVYTHHAHDLNVDHGVTHEAVNVACRPQPSCPVKQVFYFEVPCSTTWGGRFSPTHYVNVDDSFHVKMEAAQKYEEELREWPHARSISAVRALANYRGASVGIERAEAFEVGRIVV